MGDWRNGNQVSGIHDISVRQNHIKENLCVQNQNSSLPGCEGVGGDPVCESKGLEDDSQLDKTPLNPYQPDHIVGKFITHLLVLGTPFGKTKLAPTSK